MPAFYKLRGESSFTGAAKIELDSFQFLLAGAAFYEFLGIAVRARFGCFLQADIATGVVGICITGNIGGLGG